MSLPDITPAEIEQCATFARDATEMVTHMARRIAEQAERIEQLEHELETALAEIELAQDELNAA